MTKDDKLDAGTIEFGERIRLGVQKALRKLAEEIAGKGESLVVKIDGEIKEVPAKELLANLLTPRRRCHIYPA